MPNQEYIFAILGIATTSTIILLSFAFMVKTRRIKQLNLNIFNLRKSLEEMDEQAKLIVRTDLELNKTHEELDKRINCLFALQRISYDLSRTLDQKEIFLRLSPERVQEIGFSKAIIFENDAAPGALKHQIGFSEEELSLIKNEFSRKNILRIIKEANRAVSSIPGEGAENNETAKTILNITKLDSFVIAPILKKDGFYGLLLLGNASRETPLTEGDEELASILSTQIGQALDNAELFERAYSQHQELEKKVIERTKELSDALGEIQIINKRKSDFVSAVSHELRTPLTSIKGYASILLSEKLGVLPAEIKERLGKINKHSDELTHMINDMLDIARIESGKFLMKLEPLDLRQITESVIDLLGPQLKEKSINIQTHLPPELPLVLADKIQIQRVLINLMGNAIKFVSPNTGQLRISSLESADTIQVDISDNGIGMSEHDTSRIFDEFYRVDNTINQKVKGTGLGLTLVKNIILAHQGKIWVESRLNQGSTFSFSLPRTK